MLTRTTATLFALSISASSFGINPHDEYYADDVFAAVKEAKRRPHHYDYSHAKRYNRSTTQSLDIPRLLHQEMGIANIKSNDTNAVSAADIPINSQTINKRYREEFIDNQAPLIQATVPTSGSIVSSPDITHSVIAR